eukprot:1184458-Prorocentrum_minimum.AAC.6
MRRVGARRRRPPGRVALPALDVGRDEGEGDGEPGRGGDDGGDGGGGDQRGGVRRRRLSAGRVGGGEGRLRLARGLGRPHAAAGIRPAAVARDGGAGGELRAAGDVPRAHRRSVRGARGRLRQPRGVRALHFRQHRHRHRRHIPVCVDAVEPGEPELPPGEFTPGDGEFAPGDCKFTPGDCFFYTTLVYLLFYNATPSPPPVRFEREGYSAADATSALRAATVYSASQSHEGSTAVGPVDVTVTELYAQWSDATAGRGAVFVAVDDPPVVTVTSTARDYEIDPAAASPVFRQVVPDLTVKDPDDVGLSSACAWIDSPSEGDRLEANTAGTSFAVQLSNSNDTYKCLLYNGAASSNVAEFQAQLRLMRVALTQSTQERQVFFQVCDGNTLTRLAPAPGICSLLSRDWRPPPPGVPRPGCAGGSLLKDRGALYPHTIGSRSGYMLRTLT